VRVLLKLHSNQTRASLPLNYNHALSALIYATLAESSVDYATRLHDVGFVSDKRTFKLFTFSRLNFRRSRIAKDRIILEDPQVSLQISSPAGDFIEHLVEGLFKREGFRISSAEFSLQQAETLPQPVFNGTNNFRALSPITESVREANNEIRFLSTEDDWSEIIKRNLTRKYQALHGHAPEDQRLKWTWDKDYLDYMKTKGRRASALIDINNIKVRGWLAPFTIEGSKELIELGYETGFGARNSMGFGMAKYETQND
jgi:CRISPR-associated endoribonuclease Cas6